MDVARSWSVSVTHSKHTHRHTQLVLPPPNYVVKTPVTCFPLKKKKKKKKRKKRNMQDAAGKPPLSPLPSVQSCLRSSYYFTLSDPVFSCMDKAIFFCFSRFKILWLTLCQPHNPMEIEVCVFFSPNV